MRTAAGGWLGETPGRKRTELRSSLARCGCVGSGHSKSPGAPLSRAGLCQAPSQGRHVPSLSPGSRRAFPHQLPGLRLTLPSLRAARRPSADVSQRRRPLISHSLTSFPAALSPPFQQTLCSSKQRPAPAPGPPLRLSLLPGGLSVPLDAPLLLYTTSSWSPPHSGSPGHSIWTCNAPWPPSVLT